MRTLLVLTILAALVLGYGYYHAATHGWLYVNLIDSSVKSYSGNIRNGEVRLLDADGKLLADAKSDDKIGVVRLVHPQVGNCAAEERSSPTSSAAGDRWQQCFETLSTWLMGWVRRIRFADLKFAACDVKRLPVVLRENREDWWLWWVPLPHIGGKPFTYFSASISVDGAHCAATSKNEK
jgi:hypothetical protein